jgi:hypothetical protein
MSRIFLSYARENRRVAGEIAESLMLEGYELWWDDDLPVHRAYTDVIADEIRAAAAVIVVWSEHAVGSEWVRAEANEGRELKKLVQVRVDATPLPLPFNQIQYADLAGWSGDRAAPEWAKVLQSLSELMDRPVPKTGADALGIRRRFLPARFALTPAGLVVLIGAAVMLAAAGFMTLRAGADREALARQVVRETLDPSAHAPAVVRTAVGPAAAPGAHPSFDCNATSSETERFICNDPAVAAAEKAMADAYHSAKARTADPAKLLAGQRAFLVSLAEAPKEHQTLLALFHERTAQLKAEPAKKR